VDSQRLGGSAKAAREQHEKFGLTFALDLYKWIVNITRTDVISNAYRAADPRFSLCKSPNRSACKGVRVKNDDDEKLWTEAKKMGAHLGCMLGHKDWRGDVIEVYVAVEEAGPGVLEMVGPNLFGETFTWQDWYNRAKSRIETWGVFKTTNEGKPACETCVLCGLPGEECQTCETTDNSKKGSGTDP
jgi:hypothetical protein